MTTMSAEELADFLLAFGKPATKVWLTGAEAQHFCDAAQLLRSHAEQIRQAEQAARADERRKVIEECAKIADSATEDGCSLNCYCGGGHAMGASAARNEIERAIRALDKDTSEVA